MTKRGIELGTFCSQERCLNRLAKAPQICCHGSYSRWRKRLKSSTSSSQNTEPHDNPWKFKIGTVVKEGSFYYMSETDF